MSKDLLAILGGEPTIPAGAIPPETYDRLFKKMVLTDAARAAAMEVIEKGSFSATDITEKFQKEFAAWQGTEYAIAYCNGTMALTSAMFGIGLNANLRGKALEAVTLHDALADLLGRGLIC